MADPGFHSAGSSWNRKAVRGLVVAASLLVGMAVLDRGLGPWFFRWALKRELAAVGFPEAVVAVRQAAPWRAAGIKIALGPGLDAPTAEVSEIRFTPYGLWRHRLERIEVATCEGRLELRAGRPGLAGIPDGFWSESGILSLWHRWSCEAIRIGQIAVAVPDFQDPSSPVVLRGRAEACRGPGDLWRLEAQLATPVKVSAVWRAAVHLDTGNGGWSGAVSATEGQELAVLLEMLNRSLTVPLEPLDFFGHVDVLFQGSLKRWQPVSALVALDADHLRLEAGGRTMAQIDGGLVHLRYRQSVAGAALASVEIAGKLDKLEMQGQELRFSCASLVFDGAWERRPAPAFRFQVAASGPTSLVRPEAPERSLVCDGFAFRGGGAPDNAGSWRCQESSFDVARLTPPASAERLTSLLLPLDFCGLRMELIPEVSSMAGLRWRQDGGRTVVLPSQVVFTVAPGRHAAAPVFSEAKGSP